jgi:allene oxide cyclase
MKTSSVLAVALLAGFTGPALAKEVMHLVEHADTDAVLDLGAKDDSVGDLLTFANPVFDASNAKQVGTDQGYCVRTVAGKAWECWWTLMLADGQLTVQGPFLDAGDSVMAITGGTGKYSTARGQMKLHARNDKGTEYDFVYEIE